MRMIKQILIIIILFSVTSAVYANDIQISTFDELMNSHPESGDTIEFVDDLTSDASIRNTFIDLDITFEGHNHFLDGNDTFSGFVLNQDSVFHQVRMLNCKGQDYQSSTFAGAIYNNAGNLDIQESAFVGNFVNSAGLNFGVAGAVYNLNDGRVNINSSLFAGNYTYGASSFGGAVANGYESSDAYMSINDSVFSNNYAYGTVVPYGGAIYNKGTIDINNTLLQNNYAQGTDRTFVYGGAIFNTGKMTINNSAIHDNSAKGETESYTNGGAIYNASELNITNTVISNNSADSPYGANGGAIYNETGAKTVIKNSRLENNSIASNAVSGEGGAVYNNGELVIENSTLQNNKGKNGEANDIYNASDATIDFDGSGTTNILSGISGEGTIYKKGSGTLNLGGENKDYKGDFIFEEGTVKLLADSSYFNAKNTTLNNNVNFNMQNGGIDNVNFGNLTLAGKANIFPDVNFDNNTMDTISGSSVTGNGSLFVGGLALSGTPKSDYITIPFADAVLKDHVQYNPTTIHTPIYNYNASYDASDGNFDFSRLGFNSSVFASAIATQLAGYLTQIDTYHNIFSNLDMVMIMSPGARLGVSYHNKMANVGNQGMFSPLLIPEQRTGIWFKPYSNFENVPLKRGPRVSNVSYGSMLGVESGLTELKHGWYSLYGGYALYNGSHQAYDGNGIYNNGGLAGAYGAFYKDNFFSLWTANVGASVGEASTDFGKDDFAMLNTGIAQQSGYNIHTCKRRLIIQPSLLMSYSFINTFNYTTASNVSIGTEPLHAIHLEPKLKLIGNFENFLQPYLCVSFAWNIIDHAHFKVDDVYLPNLSVKPFVQYGVGVQKRWGDKVTGFFETVIRNAGRNGVALQFGLRFSI